MITAVRAYARRRPSIYHDLGNDYSGQGLSATEALIKAQLDYEVYTAPLLVEIGGARVEVPGNRALIRGPYMGGSAHLPVAAVSTNYTPLQNRVLAGMLDSVTDQFPVEVIGSAQHGRILFYLLKMGQGLIAGEDVNEYMLVQDDKFGGGGLRITVVPVRFLCSNSLVVTFARSKHVIVLNHDRQLEADVAFWINTIKQAEVIRAQMRARLEALSKLRLKHEQEKSIIAQVYPDPKPSGQLNMLERLGKDGGLEPTVQAKLLALRAAHMEDQENARVMRAAAHETYVRQGDESPALAGNAYGLLNAVALLSNWREGRGQMGRVTGKRAEEQVIAYQAITKELALAS